MKTDFKNKQRGNRLGFWFFRVSLSVFGLKGTYGLLYFVCFYYLLCDRAAVSAARAYIHRRFPKAGFLKSCFHIYILLINQGKQLIDRYAAVSGQVDFDMRLDGYERLINIADNSGQGFILLTSHVGNWQIALTALNKIGKKVYLLMRKEDNPAVIETLQVGIEKGEIEIISPDQYMGGVIEIMNALKNGHIVSIMGDRSYGVNTLDIPFLGETAYFPYSAFSMAAAQGCPIVVLFAAKIDYMSYVVDVTNILRPEYKTRTNKKEQLRDWVMNFAELIEAFVLKHPYQCFLFHDVWKKEIVDGRTTGQ